MKTTQQIIDEGLEEIDKMNAEAFDCGKESYRPDSAWLTTYSAKLVEAAREEEWKRCVDVLDFDHSKCPIKDSCIGYGTAQSDLMNNPPHK